jgi:hypothetical protein
MGRLLGALFVGGAVGSSGVWVLNDTAKQLATLGVVGVVGYIVWKKL